MKNTQKIEFCSDSSRQSGEQIFSTALRTDVWFALEVPEVHGKKALEDSRTLSQAVKEHLTQVVDSIPNARLQLIKKGKEFSGEGIKFFAAVCHEEEPNLYEFTLNHYEDLLNFDFSGVVAEKRTYWEYDRTEPLYLVCTNTKRDACCARFGLSVYTDLVAQNAENVWQASHIGGHRFAATLVALPSGVYYGYLNPTDVPAVYDAVQSNRILLPKYRGRSCYDKLVQVTEYFLRENSGNHTLYEFKLIEFENAQDGTWTAHFQHLKTKDTYCVQIRKSGMKSALKGCKFTEMVDFPQFELVDYQYRKAVQVDSA